MSTRTQTWTPSQATEPEPRRWTLEEYYRLGELGFFQGQRVELIDGEVLVMSPIGNAHAVATALVMQVLKDLFGAGFWVRVQIPFRIGGSEPEPDLAVVTGSPREYAQHPTSALLIVEVADTTLSCDRNTKSNLYASAGVAESWVLNLVHGRLEVFRDPQPDATQPFGHAYANVTSHDEGASVSPLAVPGTAVRMADLLP